MATSVENDKGLTFRSGKKQHCCVPGCNGDGRYHQDLHFHHFPKDEVQRKNWIIRIRRDTGKEFQINKSTVVCSRHFVKNDYRSWGPVKKTPQKGVTPSIFVWVETKNERRKNRSMLTKKDFDTDRVDSIPLEEDMEIDDDIVSEVTVSQEDDTIQRIEELGKRLKEKTEQCDILQQKLEIEKFGLNRFINDDSMINFYTGFPTYSFVLTFFLCIQPSASNMKSAYYKPSVKSCLAGSKRSMLLIDKMFMFFCRLRAGLFEQDLSVRFSISVSTVSRKIVTWANFLYMVLGSIPIWLSRDVIQELMPDCYKSICPRTRVIIDCTELKAQQPSSFVFNSQSYSSYKSSNTFKCLLGIAPHGVVTFVSSLYTGSMSDVEITRLSGLLDLLEEGDDVMADKGFTLRKELADKGVTLNIPHILSCKKQFTVNEVEETEQIAKLRIHIERMNRRIKEYHLFDNLIPICISGSVNQLWAIACILANFKGPIVHAWS